MIATEICRKTYDVCRGSLVALEMPLPTSARMKQPAEPMISDVSTATETKSKCATSWEYLYLFKSSAAREVAYRLQAENQSVQVASQANALLPLKEKDVTPSGLSPSP